jgi:trimethylamine--corrinoid protein Co-methyltransferase
MAYSPTPALQPIVPSTHLRLLSDEQLAQLKAATLDILETVGIHCPSEKALGVYAEHGALVDRARQTVRLPPEVVLQSLAPAPRSYTLGARREAYDLRLDGKALYCGTDGCGVETIDPRTRERRTSRKEDVAAMARVSDYLSSIGFYWPIVSAQDHPRTAPLHELDASFNNTVKHVQTETVMGEAAARYAVEMALVVAGSSHALRARPPLSLLVCTIAPLAQDKEGMESALAFAAAGLPVGFMSMANTGSTAPATIAGTIAVADAEIVAALVLIQMAYPGAPVFYSLMPGVMHPRTGTYLSCVPESEISYPVGAELAHMWGVPTLAAVFGTDAPQPGWQSAAEVASGLMLCALCGAETANGLGLNAACTVLYPEAVILDSDIYHRVRLDLAGLDTSREALALDVIRAVGPRGQFLRQRHTRDNMRRRQFSDLTTQPGTDASQDPIEAARERVRWILENHHPEPLEEAQQAELARILRAAEDERSARGTAPA